jgi:hypothetical protein
MDVTADVDLIRSHLRSVASAAKKSRCRLWAIRGTAIAEIAAFLGVLFLVMLKVDTGKTSAVALPFLLVAAGGCIGYTLGYLFISPDTKNASRMLDEGHYRIITAGEYIEDPGIVETNPFLFHDASQYIFHTSAMALEKLGSSHRRPFAYSAAAFVTVLLFSFFSFGEGRFVPGRKSVSLEDDPFFDIYLEGSSAVDSLIERMMGPVVRKSDFPDSRKERDALAESLRDNVDEITERERSPDMMHIATKIEMAGMLLDEFHGEDRLTTRRAVDERDVEMLGRRMRAASEYASNARTAELLENAGRSLAMERQRADALKKLEKAHDVLKSSLEELTSPEDTDMEFAGSNTLTEMDGFLNRISRSPVSNLADVSGAIESLEGELRRRKPGESDPAGIYGEMRNLNRLLDVSHNELSARIDTASLEDAGAELIRSKPMKPFGEALMMKDFLKASREARRIADSMLTPERRNSTMKGEAIALDRAARMLSDHPDIQSLMKRSVSSLLVQNRKNVSRLFTEIADRLRDKETLRTMVSELEGMRERSGNIVKDMEHRMIAGDSKDRLIALRAASFEGFGVTGKNKGTIPDPVEARARYILEGTDGLFGHDMRSEEMKGYPVPLNPGGKGKSGSTTVSFLRGGRVTGTTGHRSTHEMLTLPHDIPFGRHDVSAEVNLKYWKLQQRYFSDGGN